MSRCTNCTGYVQEVLMGSRINFRAAIVLAYLVAALSYAIEGADSGKGIGGWIVDMIFRLTGSLALNLSAVIAFVLVAVPGLMILAALMRKLPPAKRPAPESSVPLWPFFLVITILGAAFPWGLHRWLSIRDA